MRTITIGSSLQVGPDFDEDGDLFLELYNENLYLAREYVIELRDHLNKVLNAPVQLSPAIESFSRDTPIDRTDEFLEALAAIKDAVVDLKPINPVAVLSDQFRAALESPDTPEITLGVGEPPADQDPVEWNFAAINYAAENKISVTFEYQKPALTREAAFESRREAHLVRPLEPVNTIGPTWSPYHSFTGVDDNAEKTTFRLDRIVGFIKVLTPTHSYGFSA